MDQETMSYAQLYEAYQALQARVRAPEGALAFEPVEAEPPAVPRPEGGEGLVPLDAILCTEALHQRPQRAPDYATENRALAALALALTDAPHTILQTLAEKVLEILQADSAGLSLLTKDATRFYWAAIAGRWHPHRGGGTPRDFGPCGDVLDCNTPLLFRHWERRYPYLLQATPLAKEGLLVPFHVAGRAVGTIWAIAHDDRRTFDAEDLRLLESLGRFASTAYQAVQARQRVEALNGQLRSEIAERQRAEEELRARAAALRASQDHITRLNAHLRTDLARLTRLQEVSTRLVEAHDFVTLLDEILDAALAITSADKGTIQLRDGDTLQIVAQRGFDTPFLTFFAAVHAEQAACGTALQRRERVIVEDVLTNPLFAGSPACDMMVAAEAHAVQSTPLTTRSGRVLGLFSTHYRVPHRPTEDELRLLDLLARQAADCIERAQGEAALRELNATLEQRVAERTALLTLIQDVTRAANEASSSAVALQYALDRVCAYIGWPIGHVYLAVAPAAGRWEPTALWHLDTPERYAVFQQATQALVLVAGESLVGRVGARGQPAWWCEVATDPAFQRRHAAQAAGLRTGMAWPLLVGPEVVGVLECYTTASLPPHPALLEAMTQIGTQLGRTIERERAAEQAQRQQEALFQREKLAALSTLLASMAHELNNPLATLVLHAELLRQDLREGPLGEPVAVISQAAARCERLVRQFLTLARQHPPERTTVALNTLVAETVDFLASPLRVDNVTVHLHLDDQVPPLWGDPHQLHQVLLNLLTNARDALRAAPGAREVTLTTQYDPAQQRITLTVADTGPGIPPALQARIFEPFFTTKPPGVGTGLGLPLCRGILEAHGGTLEVRSGLGQGATFRLTLPVGAVPAPTPAPPGADEAPVGRGQTLLVVEDEPHLASGLARLLRRDGHTVDTVANGRLALAQLAARAYDLILCDVHMPELDGPRLYRLLERQQPHLCPRFIFLTGDTLEPATQAFLEASGTPCLAKPFSMAEARRAIQRVLRVVAR